MTLIFDLLTVLVLSVWYFMGTTTVPPSLKTVYCTTTLSRVAVHFMPGLQLFDVKIISLVTLAMQLCDLAI